MASWLRKGTDKQQGGAARCSYRCRAGAGQSRAQMEQPQNGITHMVKGGVRTKLRAWGLRGGAECGQRHQGACEPAAELHLQNHPAPCPAGPQGCPGRSPWGPWGQESRWMRLFCPVLADARCLQVTEISFCFNRRKTSHGKCHPVFSFKRWRKEVTYTKVSFGE